MIYSLTVELHNHIDKNGLQKVQIRALHNRIKACYPLNFKVKKCEFSEGVIINNPNAKKFNAIIKSTTHEIEGRILDHLKQSDTLSPDIFKRAVKGFKISNTDTFNEFIIALMEEYKNKISFGRLKHYEVVRKKIEQFAPGIRLEEIDYNFILKFESHLRKNISNNTLLSNMSILKAVIRTAYKRKMIKENLFENYKMPSYIETNPVYLTLNELDKLDTFVDAMGHTAHKIAAKYFLFSCYTGLRISDVMAFDYGKRVIDGNIILRAKKNGNIVSIPIYPKLQHILEFVKEYPLQLREQTINIYIKEVAKMAGINKKIKFHSGRHSWAIMLLNKGLTVDEVAETLGDSPNVAKVYAKITNPQLKNRILLAMG